MTAAPISTEKRNAHRFCVAPMMAWTDRHARFFLRRISRNARLYTEMVTANALIHGNPDRFLDFDPSEHPVALQLGGSDPVALRQTAKMGEDWGYDEINLNVGCPSDRVSSGHFGACLMAQPNLVADCVQAMADEVSVPVTVKCRIGIDDMDPGEPLDHFIGTVKSAGCKTFIIHARKAWLQGLSPKENRDVPPLDYDRVYALKKSFPDLTIIINGGITTLDQAAEHLAHVDGVMLGRAAYETPYILSDVDQLFFASQAPVETRVSIVEEFIPYCEEEVSKGTPLHRITRHILGLFHGCPGARQWRRHLSTHAVKKDASTEVLRDALQFVSARQQAA